MKYELDEMIGAGSFARVYIGRNKDTGEQVTIKMFVKRYLNKPERKIRVDREMEIPKFLQGNLNVANIIEIYEDEEIIYIVSEYIKDAIPLDRWQIPDKSNQDNFIILLNIMYQLTSAYMDMHNLHIAHRDIKPGNIIMKGNIPIIIDFDLSCIDIADTQFPCTGKVGTPHYYAPEVWANKVVDYFTADIYSLGVVFYYLMNNQELPYDGNTIQEYGYNVIKKLPKPSKSGNKAVDRLIRLMLKKQPENRPSLEEIKNEIQKIIKEI